MGRAAIVYLALTVACASAGSVAAERRDVHDLDARLAELERHQDRDRNEAEQLQKRSDRLRGDLRAATAEFDKAAADFEQARLTYEAAEEAGGSAAEGYEQAAEGFRVAEERYRAMVFVLAVAAAWDEMGEAVCSNSMTTRQYRAQLRDQGVDLEGQDIDHIMPHALGGADNSLNYQVMPSSLNRSLGASLWEKFRTQPLDVVRGMLVSAVSALRCSG